MQALNTYKPPPMPIDHLATFVNYEMSAQHNTQPTKRAASAILCERNAVFWEIGKERNSDKDRMAGIRSISVGHHALDCEVYGLIVSLVQIEKRRLRDRRGLLLSMRSVPSSPGVSNKETRLAPL